MNGQRFALFTSFAVGVAICGAGWAPVFVASPYRTLIVGGGPDQEHNQVAIESNVRYLGRILPPGSETRVLFADGDPNSKDIQCEDENSHTFFKKSDIAKIDGPSAPSNIRGELASMADAVQARPSEPVLVYFTGHGSPNLASQYENNSFDLWNHKELTVRQLASSLKAFPSTTPIALVMVECFSGSFANLIFENGDAKGDLANLNLCGFFASVPNRPAAGCTAELKESNYRDFSSYFFAALSGVDRMGNKVTGADYNHDGKVGMDEAFAYSLIHDDSIDTPVCTSDVFLRRFITTPDPELMQTPFSQVQRWASPAQLAALNALSAALDLHSDLRVGQAYEDFRRMDIQSEDLREVHLYRFVRLAKSVILAHMMNQSSDANLKARFASLVAAEHSNPIR